MSLITPSGNKKKQIGQQMCYSNTSDDLFSKFATDSLSKIALSPPVQSPGNFDVNNAMEQGNMRGNNIPEYKNPEHVTPSAKSVIPSGNAGISQFLAPTGEKDESADRHLLDEKMKLRRAAGQGFAINLSRGDKGAFTLILVPPDGYKIPNPDDFVRTLLQAVAGDADEIGDPDPRTGAMKIVYRSRDIGPRKVVKK